MKKLTIPFLFLCTFLHAQQDEIQVKSTVKEVTLYLSGVQEVRQAKVSIPQGSSVLRFTGLPSGVNPSSIQLRGVNEFAILSVNYRQNHLSQEGADPETESLRDSLNKLMYQLEVLNAEKLALSEERSMFQSNRKLANNNGLIIDDLHEISDFASERIRAIDLKLMDHRKTETKLNASIQRINAEINQVISGRQKATGEILVNVSAKKAISGQVQLTYFTQGAGWSPFYDLRAEEVGGPVSLAYKAHVSQITGSDWENVKLTLSTSSPNFSNNIPVVPVWYLDFIQYRNYNSNGVYNGAYSNTTLNTESGKAKGGNTYSWQQNAQISQNALNTEFKIASAYSIPSDGIEYVVEIGNYDFPAKYRYSTVPKMAEDAFLMARVSGWTEYSLLSAESNIYFKGTYVGKSYINTNTTNDTLELSMGADEGVVVQRKNVSDMSSKSVSGNTKKQQEDFEISIRNTKSLAIEIEIEDQIPLSSQKEISVELLENSNAEYNKESGKLKWKIKLEPGESKSLRFSYLVKYPKNFVIQNL